MREKASAVTLTLGLAVSTSLVQQAGLANAEAPAYNDTATGVVFDDTNGNNERDTGEPGVPDVSVSNGRVVSHKRGPALLVRLCFLTRVARHP